jgi:uncharacterized membrane protein
MKSAIRRTFQFLLKRWYLVLLVVILDIAFLYYFGRTYAAIFTDVSAHLNTINGILQQSVGTFTQNNDPNALGFGLDQFNTEVAYVKSTIITMLEYLFCFWLGFEGVVWYFIYRIADVKKHVFDYAWRFILATIGGFALFVAWGSAVVWLSVKVFSSPVPLVGQTGLNIISGIIAFVLLYLVLVAYSVLEKGFWKKWFAAAIRRITTTGLAYVCGVIAIFVLAKILGLILDTHNILLGLAYAVIVLLPAVAALRAFMIEVIKEQ